jgi:hypothetical protein
MKTAVAGGIIVVLTGALVVLAQPEETPIDPSAATWQVVAPRSVRWSLTCRVMAEKLDRSAYNPHDWVNRMDHDGRGSESGQLITDNGRCTLTKTAGRGEALLKLSKAGVSKAESTDRPDAPAHVELD